MFPSENEIHMQTLLSQTWNGLVAGTNLKVGNESGTKMATLSLNAASKLNSFLRTNAVVK